MLKKSIVAALCMMIFAPMAMGQVLVNYQIQMVDEFLRPKSFDGSLSIYIYRPGTTDQISVYKPYSYRSFLCAQPITTTSVNSPIYGSANSLIFATAWTSVDLVITDGTFDRTLYSCAPDRTYRLMWPSFGRDWLENTQLSDTAGDGDTTKIWSADKVFDELSGKQDLNARLTAVSVLSPNADEGMYWSGPTQLSLFSFTSFARDLMADPNGDAMLGTIDPNLQSFVRVLDANETVVTITSDVNVVGGFASSTLSIDGNDITYVATTPWWVTRLESDANEADFKAGVNLEIGTDVQAYDADLTTWAGITPHASWQDILDGTVTTGSNRTAINTELGLGTGDSPQFTAVNIGHATDTTVARSGAGDLTVEGNAVYRAGGTDVPVADGGTGASTLTDGGVLLGSGTGAITPMAVLAANQIIVGDGTTDPTVLTVDVNEIALWDGAETDTERRTWKGDHNLDHAYDVRDYGATGDGATDDTTAFTNAKNAADDSGGILWLPAGDYELTDDLTISSNVTLAFSPDATISIATGKTLTIYGGIAPTMQRIFICNGTGAVVFGIGSVDKVYPQWWGGVPDAVTNSLAACQAAAIAASAAKAPLYFSGGTWVAAGKIVDDLHISIKGEGPDRSIVDVNDYAGSVFVLNDNSTVEGLEVRGDDQSYGAVAFDEGAAYTYLCRFSNLRFRHIGTCIDLEECWGSSFRDIFAVGVGKGLELSKANNCTLDQIYINGHSAAAIRIQDSRNVGARHLIIENGSAASAHRIVLQGVECGTIDGVYFEGTLGTGARDLYCGVFGGLACREITVKNVYHNTGGVSGTGVAPIYVSSTYGLHLEGWYWYSPGVGYFPSYIESASGVNYVTISGWQLYGTSPLVPLCDDLRALRVVGPLGRISSEFLTTVDSGGRYPRVDGWVYDNEIHAIGTWRKPQKSLATVTAIYTIDLDDDASTDDYPFDDDAANTTEQVITLTGALPAYAELVSCQLRCFETVTGSATMSIDVGTTSGGDEILAAANTDSANDINTTAATAGPVLAATNAARSIYVNATPGANWNTLDAGRWAIMITYIDYGAVYTQRNQ